MNATGKYDFRQFQEELAALDRAAGRVSDSAAGAGGAPAAPAASGTTPTAAPGNTGASTPAAAPAAPAAPKRRGRPPKVDPMAPAKADFEALRVRYGLTVADVVSWFPPEEGIAYLQSLIASAEPKPRKRKASAAPDPE